MSAARRAARPERPPPLRSRCGEFPNFPRSAPRMRPPRRLRPRPSAPAALPPLPPILCLLSRSWHLSQRARFPAHPFAAGSRQGRGYGRPGEEGTVGGARRLWAPQLRETARGWWPCPRTLAPLFRGEVNTLAVPRIPTRPPGAPGHARYGRGRGAAPSRFPPPPRTLLFGPARAGGAGGASSGFAARAPRLVPQPRVRAPAGMPPRALPVRAPPARGPSRLPVRGRGHRSAETHQLSASPSGACAPEGRGQAQAPALARPRRPGTEAAAEACSAAALRGAGCHDCGQQGARAHARARLGDPGRTDGPWPDRSPVRAADSSHSRRARPCEAAVRHGSPDEVPGQRDNFLLPWPRAQDLREEVLGRSFALSEPDDYAVAPWQRGSSPRPSPGPRPAGLQGPDTG